MAAAQAISDIYIRTRSDDDRGLTPVDLRTLHATLMENVLYGYDVLPSAVHLTASTLAMLAPEVAFRAMNLYVCRSVWTTANRASAASIFLRTTR